MSTKNNNLKSTILKSLPKGFKCAVSKTNVTVQIWVDTTKVGGWETANTLVYDLAKKLNLEEVGAGTDMTTMVRDWEFTDKAAEKQMIADAKAALNAMKAFFKKYGNAYCASERCYEVIDNMRSLVETDES